MSRITIVAAESETADRLTGWLAFEHVVGRLRSWPGNCFDGTDVFVFAIDGQSEGNDPAARSRLKDFRRAEGPGLILTGKMDRGPRWAVQAASETGSIRAIFPFAPVALKVAIRSILRRHPGPEALRFSPALHLPATLDTSLNS